MQSTLEIIGIEFYAYHGFYEQEKKIGGKYIVDIILKFDSNSSEKTDQLKDTINYEAILELVLNEMKISSDLIEHITQRIIYSISTKFNLEKGIKVCVKKMNPPLLSQVDYVSYTLEL